MRNVWGGNNKNKSFLEIFLLVFGAVLFSGGYLYAAPIIKDTDFFIVYNTTSLPQATKVSRLDNVQEFFQKSTGLLYKINYDNLSYTTNLFEIPTNDYYSSADLSYKNDGRVFKIARDLNNDVYIAGNKYLTNPNISTAAAGYDTISKYSNNVLQWSIAPSTSNPSLIISQGLIIPKNKTFLYAIYYGGHYDNGYVYAKKIYRIDKNSSLYSLIYSSSNSFDYYLDDASFIVDDDGYVYILARGNINKLILQKIDSYGNQIFIKEFTGTGNTSSYIKPHSLQFLEDGLLFVAGEDGYSSNSSYISNPNHIIILIDTAGNILQQSIVNNIGYHEYATYNPRAFGKSFAGIDKDGIYYLYYDLNVSSRPEATSGMSKLIQHNYQGEEIKTLYLPGRIDNNSYTSYIDNILFGLLCWRNYFVQNKRLYVPYTSNGSRHFGYTMDVNNLPISLKFSNVFGFENSVVGNFKAVQGQNSVPFRVKYKNFREKAPLANFPRVRIYLNDIEIIGSPFVMSPVDASDIDYAKGIEYEVNVPLTFNFNRLDETYTYNIEVADGVSNFISDRYKIYEPSFVQDNKSFNYPNPFNPNKTSTKVVFHTPKSENVKIKIYSLNGKKIFEDSFNAVSGQNEYEYKGRDGNEKTLYNGIYLCVIEKSGGHAKCKIAIVK